MDDDTASRTYINDLNEEELERKADAGQPLSDEELELLVSHGRCPMCGKLPDAEPGFVDCMGTGFHQNRHAERPGPSDDSDQTSSQGTSKQDHDADANASSQQDHPAADESDSQPTTPSYVHEYLDRGWSPIPLKPNDKAPRFTGWQSRNFDFDDFAENDNVGLKLGPASRNLVDVDLDSYEGVLLAPRFLPKTEAIFGRRSKPNSHYLYQLSPEDILRRIVYQDPDGSLYLEVRGDGQQTMAPASIHPSGEPVEWDHFSQPSQLTLASLTKQTGALAAAAMLGRHWQDWKHRHHMIVLSLAGGLIRAGWSEETVLDFVQAVCLVGDDDDWEDRRKAVESTAEKHRSGDEAFVGWPRLAETIGDQYVQKLRESLQIPKRVAAEGVLTDTGNADRFITRHGKDVRYCEARGGYYVWDGTRWAKDDHGAVMELAKETARSIFEEAKAEKDHTKAQALAKWAATSLNYARLTAMVNTAKTDPSIVVQHDAFDQNPWAFNVMNGTIDLMTGGLRTHDRGDLLTKRSPIVYDPDATAPGWTAFLLQSTGGDQATVDYLQRLIGYMLTGRTTEQIMAILYGDGQNGKSVFVKTLEELFGDYSLKIPTGVLMHKRGEQGAPTDLAQLPGARLVVANETSQGGRLDEALVKDMTGGDRLVGRHLYHPPFEFDPTHKLLLYGNYLPVIRGTDQGIWRRIRLIPFNAKIPESERKRNLGEALLPELPGILRWAVEGCLMWRRAGPGTPPKVEGATEDYRAEMDVLGRFLEECTDTRDKVKGADLYEAYAAWAKASGEFALSTRVFGMELTRRGIKKWKSNGILYRTGIRLNPTGEKYRSGLYRVGIKPDDVAS